MARGHFRAVADFFVDFRSRAIGTAYLGFSRVIYDRIGLVIMVVPDAGGIFGERCVWSGI